MSTPRLRPLVATMAAYAPSRHPAPCDLDLAGTELPPLDPTRLARDLAEGAIAGYPSAAALVATLAERFALPADRILVTAGSDDALERACRTMLEPGRSAIVTEPTFEMLPRFIRLTGAACRIVPWPDGPLPIEAIRATADASTTLIAVVTPNNPTGTVASTEALLDLADTLPETLLLVDLAYVEFADDDPTPALLTRPNVVVTRTLSKGFGLPMLRVGFALGPAPTVDAMRRLGLPYPAAAPALAAARASLGRDDAAMTARAATVRRHRRALHDALERLGADPVASSANFISVPSSRAPWLRDALAGQGIATRAFGTDTVERIRITVPVEPAGLDRLVAAITCALAPEALLFDLDGVLADVSRSYRDTILATAARFGATLTADDVRRRKALGNANDDWALTHELIRSRGATATLSEVTDTFESLYQGAAGHPGLRQQERLLVDRDRLRALATRWPLGIVTGRPRRDAERFLADQEVAGCFRTVICREDAPLKPDPAPVRLALARLGVTRAWMIGDTPDDIVSARAAGVIPIGVLATPHDAPAPLRAAGAARVLTNALEIVSCLP